MIMKETTLFRPYPFEKGEHIYIDSGPRRGDWEIVKVTDNKVILRCPVSRREFEWDRFCYYVERRPRE